LIGKVRFSDWAEGVYVASGYAYVANTWLDVRHLDCPVLVDTFDVMDWVARCSGE
jgi:hypothetical protein